LFRNGRSQAVRIPKEFEFPGEEVVMSRDGDRLVLEPAGRATLEEVLAKLPDLEDESDQMGEVEDYPPEPVDL
jgi:antitoxin VapB